MRETKTQQKKKKNSRSGQYDEKWKWLWENMISTLLFFFSKPKLNIAGADELIKRIIRQ